MFTLLQLPPRSRRRIFFNNTATPVCMTQGAEMRTLIVAVLFFSFSALVHALGHELLPCSDGTALLPFVTKQLQPGSSLIIFQGTASPQYACVAASWSAHTQDLEVDVKVAESVDEVMRLAAPCQSHPSTFPCAVGINTSSTLIFSENSMLDTMVTQASAGAVRALPYGLFAFLVSQDDFSAYVGGVKGDGADETGVSARSTSYHAHNRKLFTDPDVQLTLLSWPATITDSALHSSWLAQAAIDAWLSVVPFPYVFDAHAVVDVRSSFSFSDNSSHAIGANGRQCFLADIHIDRALYYLSIKDYNPFLAGAWFCIDLSSMCLFSALNLNLKHPSRDRIEMNFMNIYWKLHLFDRTPLPPMPGCDSSVAVDGKRLSDLYGHLPGYWIHSSLVVATFEKNITKWSGEPTDQLVKVRGIKATKKLKAGKSIARIPKVGGLFSPEQLPQSDAWPALKFMLDQNVELNMIYTVGLAYEMLNSAKSPWKPLICNFQSSYDNFMQMQILEELERCSAEVGKIHGIVAAVVALFPKIFPTGLPSKYFMHARMAVISRAWGSDGQSVLCPIADLFNHQEPTHAVISIRKRKGEQSKTDLDIVEVVLDRAVEKGEEVFNAYSKKTCLPHFIFNFGYAPMEARNNSCVGTF